MTELPKLRRRRGRGPQLDADTSAALECAKKFVAERHRLGYLDPSPVSSEGLLLPFIENYGDEQDRQQILGRARNGCPDALALVQHHLDFKDSNPLPDWVLEFLHDAVTRRKIEKKPRAGERSQRDNIIRRCVDFVMMGGMPKPEGGTSFRPRKVSGRTGAARIVSLALAVVGIHMTPNNVEAIWRNEHRTSVAFNKHLSEFHRRNGLLR